MFKKSKKDILQAPRGMRDFTGNEYRKYQNFWSIAQKIAENSGFSGIETPIMEHTEIFQKGVGKGTDIVDKEMYNLETIGGDRLTLRPEGTAGIMRSYIEHGMGSLPQPLMFYYSGPFFRHEKPQKGRYRQLYQFGLEIMGSKTPIHDALIIQVGYKIVKKTGKEITVEINSLGSNDERAAYIEKLRLYYKENIENIAKSDLARIETNPLRILDSKEESTKLINKNAPLLTENLGEESQKYFDTVLVYLKEINIPYKIVPSLVRGLDYYEHTVFEYVTFDEKGNKSNALGGGGRYDGLAEKIGHSKAVPSVGLGLGVDRIIEISDNNEFKDNKTIGIYLIGLGEQGNKKALSVINQIDINENLRLYCTLTEANLKKQLSRAEESGANYAIILGEEEIKKGLAILKNLSTREQKEINLKNIKEEISKL